MSNIVTTLDRLFAYSDNCRPLLQETLAAHPEVFDAPFTTTSRHNTIRKLFAHSIGAEERWITLRIQGKPLPSYYEERAATTLDAICTDAKAIREATNTFRATLSPTDYDRVPNMILPQEWGFRDNLTLFDVLFHIVNHESYHRGQIIMAMQRMGIDPPNFDYVFLR